MIEVPRTVPIGGRRIVLEALNAGEEDHARSVVGCHRQGRFQGASRLIPAACPIGAEPLRFACTVVGVECVFRNAHQLHGALLAKHGGHVTTMCGLKRFVASEQSDGKALPQ
jgi:hypothetical protein